MLKLLVLVFKFADEKYRSFSVSESFSFLCLSNYFVNKLSIVFVLFSIFKSFDNLIVRNKFFSFE